MRVFSFRDNVAPRRYCGSTGEIIIVRQPVLLYYLVSVMIPSYEEIKSACPDISEPLIRQHISRLGERYFDQFSMAEISAHLVSLQKLSADHPVDLIVNVSPEGDADVTVLAFDYPHAFSLITGILGAMGMKILSGEAYTYMRSTAAPSRRGRGGGPLRGGAEASRRRIIDRFIGTAEPPVLNDEWKSGLQKQMEAIFSLLEKGGPEEVARARHTVNELVVDSLSGEGVESESVLYPVEIHIDNDGGPHTRMHVISFDTPFFLYTLSTALSLHDISIELVRISTSGRRIHDEFDMVDAAGGPVADSELIDRIKLSVLLTKQFTYFLGKAPDPYAALSRFEKLVDDILKLPRRGQWVELLSTPHVMKDLARLLGMSDFIWEDFIRLQYETLIPMLEPGGGQSFAQPVETIPRRMKQALLKARSRDDEARILNEFKDREIFLLDMEHILDPQSNFRSFSERLTALAEHVVNTAAELSYNRLAARHGFPRTVAGLRAEYSILGLGKLGGEALGYASDIELLFVYSDSGMTDGPSPVENTEFFNLLVREVIGLIKAKREGIFSVDVRLRPFGKDGPLATSLESFCTYYGPGGAAHSYERLSLVRMRPIGGDVELGERLERLRDEFIYFSRSIDPRSIREVREKQFREKTEPGRLNAKFSPGALVDLEYSVQILQVLYGTENPSLRTPRIHRALGSLAELGVLGPEESAELSASYDFLRKLINGLRMLRGSANDLFIPQPDSDEYLHLARRMGYEKKDELSPARQLHIEFDTRTAVVRAFVERHLGRDSLPGPLAGNIADIVLSDRLPEGLPERILKEHGFGDPARALVNLRKLSGAGMRREIFAMLAVLACDILARKADPDMALNNWERFIAAVDSPEAHYGLMLSQPRRLDILLSIFSASQFLADALIRNPEFLDWVTSQENLYKNLTGEMIAAELRELCESADSHEQCLGHMRLLRRREILRIGTRDIVLNMPLQNIVADLSKLAEALAGIALERAWLSLDESDRLHAEENGLPGRFCIMAFGKLGGHELNYSSDIDLLGIYGDNGEGAAAGDGRGDNAARSERIFTVIMERVAHDLSAHTGEGYAYRVDLRLRPYGRSGMLVHSAPALKKYYGGEAALWEIQALLKMRPVAGALRIGGEFLAAVWPVLIDRLNGEGIAASIAAMREKTVRKDPGAPGGGYDVKNGAGGIRDIEFLVQGLQLIHCPRHPDLIGGNTLHAVAVLAGSGILPADAGEALKNDYIFLRRVEHFLQLFEDRQVHALPMEEEQLQALARRILGPGSSSAALTAMVEQCARRVRTLYRRYLLGE